MGVRIPPLAPVRRGAVIKEVNKVEFKSLDVAEPEEGRKILNIELDQEALRAQMEKEYSKLGKKARISGFRKGRAPRSLLEAKYGDAVRSEALESLVSRAAWHSLKEKEIVPFFDPEIDELSAAEGETIRFKVSVDAWPRVEMNQYGELEFNRKVNSVSDEDIERELSGLQQHQVDFSPVERAAAKGDRVKLSYQRFLEDGSAFGKRVDDIDMILDAPPGSDVVPATLAEGMVGIEKGETRPIPVDFPEDHPARSLAGKKVEFRIEAREIAERSLATLDDAFATRIMGTETTLDELKEKIREGLGQRAEEDADRELQNAVFNKLLEVNPVHVSHRIRERVAEESMPQFIPEEEIPEDKREEARRQRESIIEERKKGSLLAIQKLAIVTEISKRENLEPTEREVSMASRAVMARDTRSLGDEERREEKERVERDVRRALREEKVFQWVKEHSTVNEG